jgi:NADH-quinone oxidoreductase subunit N
VAVISSVISAFFYLRVLVVAYLQEPVGDAAAEQPAAGRTPALGVALGLAGLLTVAIGLAPEALIAAARTAERILW